MPILRELDRSPIFENPGTSSLMDYCQHGNRAATRIKSYLRRSGQRLSKEAQYLGLGVGLAYPEIALARQLGITPERVTFIDRYFPSDTLRSFQSKFPGVNTVTSGIFAYLGGASDRRFSVVSVFGLDYAISANDQIRALIEAFEKIMIIGGIVAISPYSGKNVNRYWRSKGFESLNGFLYPRSDIYVLTEVRAKKP